jgi:protein required for attachment to host cells
MILKNGTILLVADGSRMLLLRNDGDAVYPDLKVIEHRAFDNPANRELLSDAPGVGFASMGPGHNTYDEADPHQQNEDRFAAGAARALAEAAGRNGGDLIVVAPPDTLGVLRRHYDRTVKSRLLTEIAKDLTKHPVPEITRLIAAHEA